MQPIENLAKASHTDYTPNYYQNLSQLHIIKIGLSLYKNARGSFAAAVALGVLTSGLVLFPLLVQNDVLSPGLHWAFLIIISTLGSSFFAWWVNPKRATYSVELCERLAEYDPIDKHAYRVLQKNTKKYGGINPRALKDFLDSEWAAISAQSAPAKILSKGVNDFLTKVVEL